MVEEEQKIDRVRSVDAKDLWCRRCRKLTGHTRAADLDTETHAGYRCWKCDAPYLRSRQYYPVP